jgi:hypothetical protein
MINITSKDDILSRIFLVLGMLFVAVTALARHWLDADIGTVELFMAVAIASFGIGNGFIAASSFRAIEISKQGKAIDRRRKAFLWGVFLFWTLAAFFMGYVSIWIFWTR